MLWMIPDAAPAGLFLTRINLARRRMARGERVPHKY
jgi:hypothetical protein